MQSCIDLIILVIGIDVSLQGMPPSTVEALVQHAQWSETVGEAVPDRIDVLEVAVAYPTLEDEAEVTAQQRLEMVLMSPQQGSPATITVVRAGYFPSRKYEP